MVNWQGKRATVLQRLRHLRRQAVGAHALIFSFKDDTTTQNWMQNSKRAKEIVCEQWMWGLEPCKSPPTFCSIAHSFHFASSSKSLVIPSWPMLITAAPQLRHQNEKFALGHSPQAAAARLSSLTEPCKEAAPKSPRMQHLLSQCPRDPADPNSHPAESAQTLTKLCQPSLDSGHARALQPKGAPVKSLMSCGTTEYELLFQRIFLRV